MEKDFSCQKGKKLVLKEKGKTHLVEIAEITHLTCEGQITKIQTIKNEDITVKFHKVVGLNNLALIWFVV